MRNGKMAIVFAVALALTQARAAFASADDIFLKYLKANDMRKLEKFVNSKAQNINLDWAMGMVFEAGFNKTNALPVIQLLVRNGANINKAGYPERIPPLMRITYASNFTQQQRMDIARYLLDNKADVNARDGNGDSSIVLAADRENWELVKLLLERGANPNVKHTSGFTPLHGVVIKNQLELAKLMLEKGANPNDESLHYAAIDGRFEMVKLLLEKRANPNGRFDDDSTALIWAAKKDYNEIAYDLVEYGANVNLRNTAGETAASIAYDRGNIELYNYLLAYGAVLFEPKQAAAPPPAPAPQSTTNVYVQPSAPSSSSYGSSSPPPAAQPKKRMFTGQVWYLDNGTRKSIPLMEQAFTADEAEKAAERKFKTGPVGLQKGVIFLEAAAN